VHLVVTGVRDVAARFAATVVVLLDWGRETAIDHARRHRIT